MTESYNWELMGPVYKSEAEALRALIAVVKSDIRRIAPRLSKQVEKMDILEQASTERLLEVIK